MREKENTAQRGDEVSFCGESAVTKEGGKKVMSTIKLALPLPANKHIVVRESGEMTSQYNPSIYLLPYIYILFVFPYM